MSMKKKHHYSLVAALIISALNIQWLDLVQEGHLFKMADALYFDTMPTVDADGGGGGFEPGVGYDFLYDPTIVVVPADVVRTPTVPNPGNSTKLVCPWDCGEDSWYTPGFYGVPEMCTEGNLLIADIQADINTGKTGDWDGAGEWGANSVYDAGEKVAWDGVWVWQRHNVTTGIGWTAWWVGLADYCLANGWWTGSNKAEIAQGTTATLTFTIAENIPGNGGTYSVDLLLKTTEVVRMEGKFAGNIIPGGQTVTTPSFNSPFVYLSVPDGQYSISLDSEWDRYQSVTPTFTGKARWDVTVHEGQTYVGEQAQNHLFYELAMHRIDLSRHGENFASKEALVSYLSGSKFFTQLEMTETEKSNSLGYLIPRLPDSENYYLTVLTEESVQALSSITVSPAPEKLVRTYYAIYPTSAPVATDGGLQFVDKDLTGDSVVKEYGEIIVKPEMYVFWK